MKSQPLHPRAWAAVPFIMIAIVLGMAGSLLFAAFLGISCMLLGQAGESMEADPHRYPGRRALTILRIGAWLSVALFMLRFVAMLASR